MQRFSLQRTVRPAYLTTFNIERLNTAHAPYPSIRSVYNAGLVLQHFRRIQAVRHRLKPGLSSQIRSILRLRLPIGLTRSRGLLWQHEILPLLADFRSLQATDPRDKVFAVFSILKSYVPDSSINYCLNTQEVYKQVVRDAIESTKSLDVLSYCGKSSDDLPSWVPDWRHQNNARLLCASHNDERRHMYSSTHGPPRVVFNSDNMTVQGLIVDRVKLCSELSGPFRDEYHSDWTEIALQLQDTTTITEVEIIDIYRRTLQVDCIKLKTWKFSTHRSWIDNIKERWYIIIDGICDFSPGEESPVPISIFDLFSLRAMSDRRFRFIFRRISSLSSCTKPPPYASFTAVHESEEFKKNADEIAGITTGRRLCTTEGWRLGLVPKDTRAGDIIALLAGAKMPFVLRRVIGGYGNEDDDKNGGGDGAGDGARYKVIGESYVHGLMDGEGWRGVDGGTVEMRSIVLV